ncbi:hypothetical protein [uncultured Dokdonia sp.]|uniref:hypothetical protein n=1 Tax=uncultured Dokdonia sp. TaxID=575653 RepID=UPI002637154D|nr:hypothetical protein [uncultured Dokdonia sp.]
MAETKIDYKEKKGFWVVEDLMELAFQYIYNELKQKDTYDNFSDIEKLLLDSNLIINGRCRGYLTLSWRRFFTGEQDELEMIRLLENIIVKLHTKEEMISVEELHSFSSESEDWKSFWDKPFPKENLLNVFNALIKMLKDEWESTNHDIGFKWD